MQQEICHSVCVGILVHAIKCGYYTTHVTVLQIRLSLLVVILDATTARNATGNTSVCVWGYLMHVIKYNARVSVLQIRLSLLVVILDITTARNTTGNTSVSVWGILVHVLKYIPHMSILQIMLSLHITIVHNNS